MGEQSSCAFCGGEMCASPDGRLQCLGCGTWDQPLPDQDAPRANSLRLAIAPEEDRTEGTQVSGLRGGTVVKSAAGWIGGWFVALGLATSGVVGLFVVRDGMSGLLLILGCAGLASLFLGGYLVYWGRSR